MKVYNIYLFRHGRSTFNQKGLFTGWLNPPLSIQGINDAKTLAMKLKNKRIDVSFYTRLKRSKDTLNYVLKNHKECKKIIKDDRMIERSYGILQGISHDDFVKKYGEKKYKLIHRGYDSRAPRGESFLDIEKRVGNFIRFLKSYIKKNKVNVAIAAHGNSIRIFRKLMENQSREKAVRWVIPYDRVFNYKIKM